MRAALVLFLVNIFFAKSFTHDAKKRIACEDFKNESSIGRMLVYFSKSNRTEFAVNFYLSTNTKTDPVDISTRDWSGLEANAFDPLKKTHIIIHGYKSHSKKPWVSEMKNNLLSAVSSCHYMPASMYFYLTDFDK